MKVKTVTIKPGLRLPECIVRAVTQMTDGTVRLAYVEPQKLAQPKAPPPTTRVIRTATKPRE